MAATFLHCCPGNTALSNSFSHSNPLYKQGLCMPISPSEATHILIVIYSVFVFVGIMERQQSFKLERKSSLEASTLEAEPRTMSKRDYEIAFAALTAYMQGNVAVERSASTQNEKEKAPLVVKPKEGKAAAAPKSTKEAGSSSGSGSGSDMELPALA